jgi:tRNA 2-thiouridine synthesizing protein A
MAIGAEVLDTRGLRCPHPILEVAGKISDMQRGDILEVLGDCPSFEKDVRTWCERVGKVLLSVQHEGGNRKRIFIRF